MSERGKPGASGETQRQVVAAILRDHQFVPGRYPDPDYCSCGTRYGLYTKGDGLYPCHLNLHVPDEILRALKEGGE